MWPLLSTACGQAEDRPSRDTGDPGFDPDTHLEDSATGSGDTGGGGDSAPQDTGDASPINARASYTFAGRWFQQYVGTPSAFADIDGDGRDDIVFGAQGRVTVTKSGCDYGQAYLQLGAGLAGGSSGSPVRVGLGDAAGITLEGRGWECIGFAVANAGDVDGDGADEVLLGAPYYPEGRGMAWLLGGDDLMSDSDVVDLRAAGHLFASENAGTSLGWTVGTAGDMDGDGRADVLLGAPHLDDTSEDGAVYLFTADDIDHDYAGSWQYASEASTRIGPGDGRVIGMGAVGTAGDLDGDGLDDLIVTNAGYSRDMTDGYAVGAVYVFMADSVRGADSVEPEQALVAVIGVETAQYFGSFAEIADDVDGDGTRDLVTGSFGGGGLPSQGGIGIWQASTLLAAGAEGRELVSTDADIRGDWDDNQVAYVGDVDGGGNGDYLLGAVDTHTEALAQFLPGECLPSGGVIEESCKEVLVRQDPQGWAGYGLAGSGDVNGDGRVDMLLSVPAFAHEAGLTYLVLGW